MLRFCNVENGLMLTKRKPIHANAAGICQRGDENFDIRTQRYKHTLRVESASGLCARFRKLNNAWNYGTECDIRGSAASLAHYCN